MEITNLVRKQLHGKTFEYNVIKYPFKTILESIYGCSLSLLHEKLGFYDTFNRASDQCTLAHSVFYSNFAEKFKLIYDDFIFSVVAPIVGEPFYYQVIPTYRVGLPGNRFVGEFHTDKKYNHQFYEVNFNVGLSAYTGESALKVMDEDGQNHIILESPYGTFFSFDHIDLVHGSEINKSMETIVSFDFRIAIESLYFESSLKSINMNSTFAAGGYFSSELVYP